MMLKQIATNFNQYQIGFDGNIHHCHSRQLLTSIDTLEFPKWQLKSVASQSGNVVSWMDVFGYEWICFGCNVSALKHAPFCHNSRSFTRREANRLDVKTINNPVQKFLTREDLVSLSKDEENFNKKVLFIQQIYKEQIKEYDVLVK